MLKKSNLLFHFFIVVFIIAFVFSYTTAAQQENTEISKNIVEIQIDGSINPSTVDYIKDGIHLAVNQNAEALLILMDTPGGLLNSTKDIVKLILNSEVPVIVYVYPKGSSATSAGAFITLAGHVAAMSPGTSIGAAHPVSPGRDNSKPEKKKEDEKEKTGNRDIMGEKIENYASSFIESIAEERGRNVEWAEDAVRESASITANEALEINVVDKVSPDIQTLLKDIDGMKVNVNEVEKTLNTSGATVQSHSMNLKQKIINVLSTPDIAFLLLSLGSLGILVEFYNPGAIFPGVAGLISLLVGFISLQILPFNYGGLILLFLGIALFVAEAYVSSYGLLGLGGAICFVLGALLLFDTQGSDLRVGYGIIAACTLAFLLFFMVALYYLRKSYGLPAQGGYEGLLSQHGEVISWEGSNGTVFVQSEYWSATSEDMLKPGDRVEVSESTGSLNIKVKKI